MIKLIKKQIRLFWYKRLLEYVKNSYLTTSYLCYYRLFYIIKPKWKTFPEVLELRKNSNYVISCVKRLGKFTCNEVWFINDANRILFLKECINLIKKS